MEHFRRLIFKKITIIFNWVSIRIVCWSCHWFCMFLVKNGFNPLFALGKDALSSSKMTSTSSNQFPIDRMRKISRISMYTCSLIDRVMVAIYPCPLKDLKLQNSYDLRFFFISLGDNFLFAFLYVNPNWLSQFFLYFCQKHCFLFRVFCFPVVSSILPLQFSFPN